MRKATLFILLAAIGLSACKKNNNHTACGTQTCTASFVYIGVAFNNSNGEATSVKDVTVVNMRTGKPLKLPPYPPAVDFMYGSILIASDENKDQFSTQGDDIKITATSATTGQVKIAVIKISGGCNCHVEKISGPVKIVFD
jgi:hypothetical protein